MKLEIKPWLIFTVLIGALIVAFSLFRGCQQNRAAVANANAWKNRTDSISKIANQITKSKDSAIQSYKDTLDFINGQLSLRDNQLTTRIIQLDSADKRITNLINKYQYLQPNKDTSITVAPNEFINDCNQCFAELSNGQEKVKAYMAQIDNLNQTYQSKISVQENRINFLDKQSNQFSEMLQNCIADSKKAQSQLKPSGKLYLSWGVMFGPFPKMAGAGLLYQNKYNVIWGAKWYYGTQGSMVEANINFPLSIKL